jgi:hypothetical protein
MYRALTMTDTSQTQRPQVWRRLLLLFLLEWIAAFAVVLLVQVRPGLPYMPLILFSSAWLGLVSGLGTRFLLSQRHWAIGSLSAVLALLSGLFILGLATGWRYGLGPQEFKAFGLAGATQLATAFLASLLAATVWRKPARQAQAAQAPASPQPRPVEKPSLAKPKRPVTPHKPKKAIGAQSNGKARKKPEAVASKTGQSQKPTAILSPAKSRKQRPKRRPEVQFASAEEHRCPYCLEIVQPDDPRGVVECKICHTLHHADCWAITGTCQVPHLNA